MTLTIFKNDDFETIGFKVVESIYNGQDLRHEGVEVIRYGISNGWRKEFPVMSSKQVECVMRIKKEIEQLRMVENFRSDIFNVLHDNDWYKNQPVKMNHIDKQIKEKEAVIANLLKSL